MPVGEEGAEGGRWAVVQLPETVAVPAIATTPVSEMLKLVLTEPLKEVATVLLTVPIWVMLLEDHELELVWLNVLETLEGENPPETVAVQLEVW